jgi:hypothetical protein
MKLVLAIVFGAFISSCSVFKDKPSYEITEGRHVLTKGHQVYRNVYVVEEEDALKVYPLRKKDDQYIIDTLEQKPLLFNSSGFGYTGKPLTLRKTSLDIDFLTIPFKYRFPEKGFPRQFNASLNGGVYFGYRTDVYRLSYVTNLLGRRERKESHLGFSFGGYSGIGGTTMNPSVTNNNVNIEYDGVVWTNGLVTIMGVNRFTVGLALGWDGLMDKNRKYWIYQKQPWLGFVVGLNLN